MQASPTFYRDYLKNELEKRVQRNPRYSLRAFSKFLGVDVGALSRLFANKQTITLRTAKKICDNLGLNDQDKSIFMESVSKHRNKIGTSPNIKSDKNKDLAEILNRMDHLKLASLLGKGTSQIEIMKLLDINQEVFNNYTERLIRVGILDKIENELFLNENFHFLKKN